MSHTHALEIHTEDLGHPRRLFPIVGEAVNFIDDALHFQLVVHHSTNDAVGVVEAADVGDFGSVEIIDASAGWAIYQIIGRMFVGPGGAST